MFNLLTAVAAYLTGKELIKEKRTKDIPAENFGDGTGLRYDVLHGVNSEERMKRLHNGYYKDVHYDVAQKQKSVECITDGDYKRRNEEYLRKKQERLERFTKQIPAENWGDGSGIAYDNLHGISFEERVERLRTGYYKNVHHETIHPELKPNLDK